MRYGRAAAAADARGDQADFEYRAPVDGRRPWRKNWFLATEAGLQAEVARATIRDGEAAGAAGRDRSRVGVGNDEDVYVARATVGAYRDALRQIELAREQAMRALELLIGRYPAAAAA